MGGRAAPKDPEACKERKPDLPPYSKRYYKNVTFQIPMTVQ